MTISATVGKARGGGKEGRGFGLSLRWTMMMNHESSSSSTGTSSSTKDRFIVSRMETETGIALRLEQYRHGTVDQWSGSKQGLGRTTY